MQYKLCFQKKFQEKTSAINVIIIIDFKHIDLMLYSYFFLKWDRLILNWVSSIFISFNLNDRIVGSA